MMETLKDKVILITGATGGLGKAVALELAQRGATLLLHGRNARKGEALLKELAGKGKTAHRYYNADFASLGGVSSMADHILSDNSRLDILINNAGTGSGKGNRRESSADGYELRLSVNYLAPWLLTRRLIPLLQQSAPSKIVNVASVGQTAIDFEDVMLNHNYSGMRAYAQSKLALVTFTFTLAEELKDTGITVNCLHPATLMDTNMVRESELPVQSPVAEGTDTVLYVALSPEIERATGVYYDHHRPAKADKQAYDPVSREKLEQLSRKLISRVFEKAEQ